MTALPHHRPDRSAAMDAFLARVGWAGAARQVLAADASFRRYERVTLAGRVAVLMDAPPPWEDVRPFLAVNQHLQHCGVRVSAILARDEAEGFLLLEDLGDLSFTRLLRATPACEGEVYLAATEALAAIYRASQAQGPGFASALKPYDMAVYLREVALLSDWFLPQVVGAEAARALRLEYLALWEGILRKAQLRQHCLVHRDYHADNLFWLTGASGVDAVGMLDYQDALWGDAAYDLASLLEDARRDVAPTTVADCIARYTAETGEESHAFAARFSVIAAQRNAKIIGIFMRLCIRDRKPHYLAYLPRVWTHFMHDLSHPLLAPMRQFIEAHVPAHRRGALTPDMDVGSIEE